MSRAENILKEYWGFDSFRPLQAEIIQSVMEGTDSLALLPTGGGKSICYQVPALLKEGITLVISPLIALMKDQVENLNIRGIKAEAIFSGMSRREIDRILDNCIFGDVKLLYLSPERLQTEIVVERIKRMNVNLIAVDEAHCISQWGYDFRPAYLQIASVRPHLPKGTPILALTATATEKVAKDIMDRLDFDHASVFKGSFVRPNLSYSVIHTEKKEAKLIQILSKIPGSAIVYVRNRRTAQDIAALLRKQLINADYYHAGLSMQERTAKQDAWKNDQCRVIVSTNAFGMGIDKPDVRLVVHLDPPESLEAYYQEAGRAGRDGKKSFAVMLYSRANRDFFDYILRVSFPPLKTLRRVYQALAAYFQLAVGHPQGSAFEFDFHDFVKNFKLDAVPTYNALRILQQEGWIALSDSFYLPSSLMFTQGRDRVYEFLLQHPKVERLLKALLRHTQGAAFSRYVELKESSLAGFLGISVDRLRKQIEFLQQSGILSFRPQTENPYITFLQERVSPSNLTIDLKAYRFRKERMQERMAHLIRYAERLHCRTAMLVDYFGERNAKPCGICDVCLGRYENRMPREDFVRYKEELMRLMDSGHQTPEELSNHFRPTELPEVNAVLDYLVDEGLVGFCDGVYQILSKADNE